jgi:hypothetical protein
LDHPDAQTLLTEVLGDPGFGEGSGSPRQDRPVASRTSRKTPFWVFVALIADFRGRENNQSSDNCRTQR